MSDDRHNDPKRAIETLLDLKAHLETIPVINPQQAAAVLGVTRKTIYRRMASGQLERIPRDGRNWVSVRSLMRFIEEGYGSTEAFNALLDEKL